MTDERVKVAVITGGHPYDVPNFHRLFRRFDGFDVYIQPMEDFASSLDDVRDSYDAVVFYIMPMHDPPNEKQWHLGTTKQGILVLHHAILAYPQWPTWNDLVGIPDRKFDFFVDQNIHVEIADTGHPITKGLAAWDMLDETYTMLEPGDDSHVILTVAHPKSMKAIGWTRRHGQSRVFCLQSGHDNATWQNPAFLKALERGMLWCAGRV